MAFTTVDSILAAFQAGRGQSLHFNKAGGSAASYDPYSMWAATGVPAAGANTASGKGNARVLTSATTGAFTYSDATGSYENYLVESELVQASAATGTLFLVDRIADCQIAHNEASGNFTPNLDATSRLGAAEGAMLWCEVTSNFSAGSNTLTLSYTNQGGTSGRSAAVVTTASKTVGRSATTGVLWQPLQAGDSGIRSIQSMTLAGAATGALNVCLVRPLLRVRIDGGGQAVGRSMLFDVPKTPLIYDSSCLAWIGIWSTSASYTVFGDVTMVAG